MFVTDHFIENYISKLEKIADERSVEIKKKNKWIFSVKSIFTAGILLACILSIVFGVIYWIRLLFF